jgi:hypothetical protein
MLVGAGLATWALNTAHALFVRGHLGVVAYDSLAPLLLVGWAEVGPWFLRQFRAAADPPGPGTVPADRSPAATVPDPAVPAAVVVPAPTPPSRPVRAVPAGHRRAGPRHQPPPPRTAPGTAGGTDAGLLAQARVAAAEHQHAHGRPVSRDALRRALRVSNQTAGALLRLLRADPTDPQPQDQDDDGGTAAGTTALAPAGPGAPPQRGPAAGDGTGGPRTDLAALVPSAVPGRDGQEETGGA